MQQSQRIKVFTKFTESLKPHLNKETMELLHQQYYIREFKIWEIDAPLAINLYFGVVTRGRRAGAEKSQLGWVENELRLFVWSLVFYAHGRGLEVQRLGATDWEFFSCLFPMKQRILFEYQANNLLKNHNQYKKWVHEQDQLFEGLVKKDGGRLRWSDLGKALFIESDRKYFRTPKQCRQRWLNHLDPSKLKKYWLEEEDFILIQFVKTSGKKWAAISKRLEGKRNEHSIKNRFKSLLTKQAKLYHRAISEEQLIENIYTKLLQNQPKKNEGEESGNQQKTPNNQPPEENQDNQSGSHSEGEQEQVEEIFQQQHQPVFEEQPEQEILANISLNVEGKHSSEEVEEKGKLGWDRQAFELSKVGLTGCEGGREWVSGGCLQSEMEKRIRADLFLQEDPFQMLKSYFYKTPTN